METTLNIKDRLSIVLKALTLNHPSSKTSLITLLPRTHFNYEGQVNGRQSAILMACVNWAQRTLPEAPVMIQKYNKDGEWEQDPEHPLLPLLDSPNPYYDGLLLHSGTIADFILDGNAYWLKIRSNGGRVLQLWWIPSSMLEPKWPTNGDVFISHYEYKPGYQSINIPPEDVVHFRAGFDSSNVRKGLSPLKSLFREIFSDDEAANMTAALLKNMGVPGMVIAPDGDTLGSKEDIDATKEWFKEHFTGDYRGEPLIMSAPTKISTFTFNPKDMDLRSLRRIPEERITAVIGIPAIVVGLGAGLDRSTFSNYAEAREAAYESYVIPTHRLFSSVIKRQLLSDFTNDPTQWQVGYDLSNVRVLQEDENALVTRVNQMVAGGYLKVIDAQRMTGSPVDDSQDYYLRPFNVVATVGMPVSMFGDKSTKQIEFKGFNEEGKEAYWRQYVTKAESYEPQLINNLREMFKIQQKDTLAQVKEGNQSPFDKIKAIREYRDAVTLPLTDLITKAAEDATNLIISKSLKQYANQASLIWLRTRIGWAAEQVGEETANLLSYTLAEGYANGESVPELSKRVKTVFKFSTDYRVEKITRTETIQASAQGAIFGYEEAGVERLEFYAAVDERICADCMALHGEQFPVKESTGIITVHPQCRCTWIPVV